MPDLADYAQKVDIQLNTVNTGGAQGAPIASSYSNMAVCFHINTTSMSGADRADFDTDNTDGKRVNFYMDGSELNANRLAYDVEYYASSGGTTTEAVYWVRIPTITENSAADNNKVWIGYGSKPTDSDQSLMDSTWTSIYDGVFHLGDNGWGSGATAMLDSSGNGNNSTSMTAPADATGQARQGRVWNNTSSVVYDSDTSLYDYANNSFSWECWIKPTSTSGAKAMMSVGNFTGSGTATGWMILVDSQRADGLEFRGGKGSGGGGEWSAGEATGSFTSTSVFKHALVTYNGSGTVTMYVNGAASAVTTIGGTPGSNAASASTVQYGLRSTGATQYCNSTLDEMRISTGVRTADYAKLAYYSGAKTSYNGDNGAVGSAKFVTWGTGQDIGGGGAAVAIMTTNKGIW